MLAHLKERLKSQQALYLTESSSSSSSSSCSLSSSSSSSSSYSSSSSPPSSSSSCSFPSSVICKNHIPSYKCPDMKCSFSNIVELSEGSNSTGHSSSPLTQASLISRDSSCKTELNHPMSVMKVADECNSSAVPSTTAHQGDCKMIYSSLANGIPSNASDKHNNSNVVVSNDKIHPELKNSYLIGQLLQQKPKANQYDCCSYDSLMNRHHNMMNKCDQMHDSPVNRAKGADFDIEYLGYSKSNQVKPVPSIVQITPSTPSLSQSTFSTVGPDKSGPELYPFNFVDKSYQKAPVKSNSDTFDIKSVDKMLSDNVFNATYQMRGKCDKNISSKSDETLHRSNFAQNNVNRINENNDRQLWEESSTIDKLIAHFKCSYSRDFIFKIYHRACTLPEFFTSKIRSPLIAGLFYIASAKLKLQIPINELCSVCGVSVEQLIDAHTIINKHWQRILSAIEQSDYNVTAYKSNSINYQCDQVSRSSNVILSNGHQRCQRSMNETPFDTPNRNRHLSSSQSCSNFPLKSSSSSSYHSRHPNHLSTVVSTPPRVQSNSSKVSSSVATSTSSTRRSPFYMIDHGHSGHSLSKQLHDTRVTNSSASAMSASSVKTSTPSSASPRSFPSKLHQSISEVDKAVEKSDSIANCLSMPTAASFLSLSLSPRPSSKVAVLSSGSSGNNLDPLPLSSAISHQSSHCNPMVHRSSIASFAQSVIHRNTQSQGVPTTSVTFSSSPESNFRRTTASFAQPLDLAALKSSSSLAASMTSFNDYHCPVATSTSSGHPSAINSSPSRRRCKSTLISRQAYPTEPSKLFRFTLDQPKIITREANGRMCYHQNVFEGRDVASSANVSQVTLGESISMS